MSKIHVLDNLNGEYNVVIHAPTPSGKNFAGKTWVELSAMNSKTVLPVGAGIGEITEAERNSILNGTVIEVTGKIKIESGNASSLSMGNMANDIITSEKSKLKRKLRYYGYTQE